MRPKKYADCVGVKVYLERTEHATISVLACGNVSEWIRRAIQEKMSLEYCLSAAIEGKRQLDALIKDAESDTRGRRADIALDGNREQGKEYNGPPAVRPKDHKPCASATCPWCR